MKLKANTIPNQRNHKTQNVSFAERVFPLISHFDPKKEKEKLNQRNKKMSKLNISAHWNFNHLVSILFVAKAKAKVKIRKNHTIANFTKDPEIVFLVAQCAYSYSCSKFHALNWKISDLFEPLKRNTCWYLSWFQCELNARMFNVYCYGITC